MNNYQSLALAASVTMSLLLAGQRLGQFHMSLGVKLRMIVLWFGIFGLVAAACALRSPGTRGQVRHQALVIAVATHTDDEGPGLGVAG